MTGTKRMITLRIEVTIPYRGKRPQRVRVVAKDRGAWVFPYRRELACVPLYKAGWRRVPGDRGAWLWQNEQAMAVPLDMNKLLQYNKMALQLYCLRGSDVKHKGVFNLRKVMDQQQRQQQQQQDELFLAMRYNSTCWWHRLVFPSFRKGEDKVVPVPGGGEGSSRARNGQGNAAPEGDHPAVTPSVPLASVPLASVPLASVPLASVPLASVPHFALQHAASGPFLAADSPTVTQRAGRGQSAAEGVGPAVAQHAASEPFPAADRPTVTQVMGRGQAAAEGVGSTWAGEAVSEWFPAAHSPTVPQDAGRGQSAAAGVRLTPIIFALVGLFLVVLQMVLKIFYNFPPGEGRLQEHFMLR